MKIKQIENLLFRKMTFGKNSLYILFPQSYSGATRSWLHTWHSPTSLNSHQQDAISPKHEKIHKNTESHTLLPTSWLLPTLWSTAILKNKPYMKYKKGSSLLTMPGQRALPSQIFTCFQHWGQTEASGLTEGRVELLQGQAPVVVIIIKPEEVFQRTIQ